MNNFKTISITLAVVLCCNQALPVVAQPQVLALPLVANPAGLVFVGAVTVAGVTWYLYEKNHKQYKSRVAPVKPPQNSSFPEPDEHGMIDLPRVPGGGYTRNQCILLAAQADRELGGNWQAIFITVNHVTGLGHCSLKREESAE